MVVDEERSVSGIVGDNGNVFISGLAPVGRLKAKWGKWLINNVYLITKLMRSHQKKKVSILFLPHANIKNKHIYGFYYD